MSEWTTGAAILALAGAAPGSPADVAWSDACASAVNAGLDVRLAGVVFDPLELPPELVRAATTAGVEAYKARETTYVDQQAAANRIAIDYLVTIEPIVGRYATTGIA